jgi:multicomponent K+:H+ antiporter subunit D
MLTALLNPLGLGSSVGLRPGWVGWTFMAVLIASGLLAACIALTFGAAPVMRFAQATANALHAPDTYVRAILSAQPVAKPKAQP